MYNNNPELPSLKSLQERVRIMDENPLYEGYKCYTGYTLSGKEAESLNRYVVDAKSPTIYNDQRSLSEMLDRRFLSLVMIVEEWEYVIGLGRYAHPDEAKRFKETQTQINS